MPILFCVTKICYNTLLQKLTQKRRDYFILHLVVTLVIIFKNTHADKEQSGSGGKDEVKILISMIRCMFCCKNAHFSI